jgi:alkylation response protein AidB-like acyl-CoA dehydrogenase
MDFSLSHDQELLRDTAKALFAKECPTTLLRAHVDDPAAADSLWTHLRDFTPLATGSCADLHLFAEELGYVAAPGVFLPTVALAAPMLAAIGDERTDAIVDGEATATLAMAGRDGVWRPNGEPVKTFVADADRVDWIVVVDDGPTVRATAVGDATLRRVETIDFSRRMFEVELPRAPGSTIDADALEAALDRATAIVATEMVGTARRLLDRALAYAKERIQFDVPIGSFLAIQHRLAECSLAVERATAATQYAAMTVDADDPDRRRSVHVAKAAAGTAARRAAKDAAQVHGGIGYTWEHDLHLFIRHAYGTEAWLGTTDWHHDRLGDLLFAAAA